MDQREAVDEIATWASADDNIRMVVVTGSVARGDHDRHSDVDVELYVREPSVLLDDRSWYSRFGEVLAVEELPNPGWHPTRLLYLVDGKIDFAICSVSDVHAVAHTRPFRVVVDKDDLSSDLAIANPEAATPPTEAEFVECVNWFVAAALMQAKLVARNEPWLVKYRDHDLKAQLLRMIEWDHRARHGWNFDTWYLGKHIDQWADADVRESLDRCWAEFPVHRARPALIESVSLFEQLAGRVSRALSFTGFDLKPARREIDRLLEEPAR